MLDYGRRGDFIGFIIFCIYCIFLFIVYIFLDKRNRVGVLEFFGENLF